MLRYCSFKQINKRWKRGKILSIKKFIYLGQDKNEFYRAMSRIGNADSLSYDTKYPHYFERRP